MPYSLLPAYDFLRVRQMDYDNLSIEDAREVLNEIENGIENVKKKYDIPDSREIVLAADHRSDMQSYADVLSGMLVSRPVMDESSMCIPFKEMMYCRIEKAQNDISIILESSYGRFK